MYMIICVNSCLEKVYSLSLSLSLRLIVLFFSSLSSVEPMAFRLHFSDWHEVLSVDFTTSSAEMEKRRKKGQAVSAHHTLIILLFYIIMYAYYTRMMKVVAFAALKYLITYWQLSRFVCF